MRKRSKRYTKGREQVPSEQVSVSTAVETLKNMPAPKFDEAMEIAMHLGIDPKKGDQLVRGTFSLPHGIGKEKRVICFAEGEEATKAEEAGAIEVGSKDLAKKIADGWMDFDVVVAHQSMMPVVSKLGRTLGPQGKMPSPKTGTVTMDVANAIKEFRAGKIEFRNDDSSNLHTIVGRRSFSTEKLTDNIEAFINHVLTLKPATSKGIFILNASLTTTMGPGISLQVNS